MLYSLEGVNGNTLSLVSYTKKALKETGHNDLIDKMSKEALAGDYDHAIRTCLTYLDIANGEMNPEDLGDHVL